MLDRRDARAVATGMKSMMRGLIYGGAFVGSYLLTNVVAADLFARAGEWVHVGRALFSFTVGYWAGKLATVLVK